MTKNVIISICLCLLAFAFAISLQIVGLVDASENGGRETISSLYLLVAQDQPVALLTTAALLVACYAKFGFGATSVLWRGQNLRWVLAATFFLALFSRVGIHHSFDLSLDEFMPTFQAKIFLSGQLLAPLDADALAVSNELQPFFTYVSPEHGLWSSHYRPVHAMLIALFSKVLLADLLNPVMAVLSVWAIADIARRVFPDHPEAPMMAALLLVVSPQFLATAGTGFSFSSHLAFNLIWLALFLRATIGGHIIAALIGFFAVGLHQVHVHPLFVAPFLLALLLGRFGTRGGLVPYIVSYGLALPIWMAWPEISIWLQTGDKSILPMSLMEVEYIRDYLQYTDKVARSEDNFTLLFLATNIFRFLLWVSPALLVLMFVGLSRIKDMALVPLLAGLGFALMVLATQVLMPNQMQGWGSRYYHPVLGNFVLFGLGGYFVARGEAKQLKHLIGVLAVISGVVLLPIRAVQVETKMGPRAATQQALENIDADVVFIQSSPLWFSADFIRNDPYLGNRPILAHDGDPNRFATFGPERLVVSKPDLAGFGLPFGTLYEPGTKP